VEAVPWQEVGDLARLGLTHRQVDESVWWLGPDGAHGGAAALARALRAAGGPWRVLGWAIDRPLLRPFAAAVYRVAARHRRRTP
jgi:predicted DCC family thiol-disulfide oxidoreductase YuxK